MKQIWRASLIEIRNNLYPSKKAGCWREFTSVNNPTVSIINTFLGIIGRGTR